MKTIEFSSSVKFGKLVSNLSRFTKIIRTFEGKDVLIRISLLSQKRSNKQNAYYWGCIIPIVKDCLEDLHGVLYTNNEVHEFLKHQFNYVEKVNKSTGEIIKLPKSTTENKTFESEEYYEKIRIFAKEWFNTEIPLPNEQIKIE